MLYVWEGVSQGATEDVSGYWLELVLPCTMWALETPLNERLGGKHPCQLGHLIGPMTSHFLLRQIHVGVMRHHARARLPPYVPGHKCTPPVPRRTISKLLGSLWLELVLQIEFGALTLSFSTTGPQKGPCAVQSSRIKCLRAFCPSI